jgi:hypothetical protein
MTCDTTRSQTNGRALVYKQVGCCSTYAVAALGTDAAATLWLEAVAALVIVRAVVLLGCH